MKRAKVQPLMAFKISFSLFSKTLFGLRRAPLFSGEHKLSIAFFYFSYESNQ